MILENSISTNRFSSVMEKLGGKYRVAKGQASEYIAQAPFKMIFSSPVLRRVFNVRPTSLYSFTDFDACYVDSRVYRLRFLGFVNACEDYDGTLYGFSLNKGKTVSEIKAHFHWATLPSYERLSDWRAHCGLRASK
ncbi:hypothetical protein [Cloacibacillus evryensis]|uniref:hypothetical protein n=1 Tax=Cloacibacillus evryensis TaxID=508460 RepID=UPI00241E1AB2|nr:hypothetical protein [Cloacibacillus evryensis]